MKDIHPHHQNISTSLILWQNQQELRWLKGAFMLDNYNSIFDTYHTFDSLFDIYPDKSHTGAVYGYRKSDGTLLEFPCTLDVSKAVKDAKGRWTASGLGLKPVVVRYSYSFNCTGAKEAWVGEGFAESKKLKQSNANFTIQKIRFLDNVTSIGEEAFRYCTHLTDITIPEGVISIGNEAFACCTRLTSITIPNSVTSIGMKAFAYCTELTNITIPDSITQIEDYTFRNCNNLTHVTIPNGVTEIGDFAFSGCTNLTSIMIPDSVTSIGIGAFENCSGLTSIMIPNSVTKIGYWAFKGCTGLTNVD